MVRKRDDNIRLCVDYRRLNDLTKRRVSSTRIDTCLDTLSRCLSFTTFDLCSGFHQMTVDQREVNKTTLTCHLGIFRFSRMPLVLCNTQVIFQRLFDIVTVCLNYKTCLVYLDDIIIFNKNTQSQLERLEKLFIRLRET